MLTARLSALVCAAFVFAIIGFGSAYPALAELAKPTNPLCKDCEEVCGAYWKAWPEFDAKSKDIATKQQALAADLKSAISEYEKAKQGTDPRRKDYYAGEVARIDGEIEALRESAKAARRAMYSKQSAVEACLRRDCFMGAEGPAPSSPKGDEEKCAICKPLADRVALLDYRIAELSELQKLVPAASGDDFIKDQRTAVDKMLASLAAARARAQRELEACREKTKDRCEPERPEPPAAAVDKCVVGQWKSEPVIVSGQKMKGGDGIVMTIQADGTLSIDYGKMTPIPASSVGQGSNLWQGTATGQIETFEGKARVTRVTASAITWKFTDPQGKSQTTPLSGLGPIALGNNPMDRSYRCNDTTLTYKNPPREFTFKRVP